MPGFVSPERQPECTLVTAGKHAQNRWKNASRSRLNTALGGNKPSGYHAHHTIPLDLALNNGVIQKAIDEGFDINAFDKYLSSAEHGGGHPAYSQYIQKFIEKHYKGGSAKEFVENQLIPELNDIIDKARKDKTSINEIAKDLMD